MDEPTLERSAERYYRGRVVKLDRGYPLIAAETGDLVRAEHDVAFSKEPGRAIRGVAVGDWVELREPEGHEKAIISSIEPRERVLVRRDPADDGSVQVLAANFEWVFIAEPLTDLNFARLERELVIAHLTGASIAVLLTKADLVDPSVKETIETRVRALSDSSVSVMTLAGDGADEELDPLRRLLADGSCAVLIGKSGVGKSTLVNRLVGQEVQRTAEVRAKDGRGRHTTVSREMIPVPTGGWIVDMPGVRGLGLWEAHEGIETAFADIVAYASQCRFRDCSHEQEPDCAVRAAVEEGKLSPLRLRSYLTLRNESQRNARQAEEARWNRRR